LRLNKIKFFFNFSKDRGCLGKQNAKFEICEYLVRRHVASRLFMAKKWKLTRIESRAQQTKNAKKLNQFEVYTVYLLLSVLSLLQRSKKQERAWF
jgi:hypothetical protein